MPLTNPTPIPFPLINGYRWNWSSCTFTASGVPLPGLQEINYAEELKKGIVRANGTPQIIGFTLGEYNCTLDFTILALELENLLAALTTLNGTPGGGGVIGSGYGTIRWDLGVSKQDGSGLTPGPFFKDVCRGVAIDKIGSAFKNGQDALVQKIECSYSYLIRNGQVMIPVNPANSLMTLG